nr:MAG TPA: hypothetical protein [Bacteriophage sp.]
MSASEVGSLSEYFIQVYNVAPGSPSYPVSPLILTGVLQSDSNASLGVITAIIIHSVSILSSTEGTVVFHPAGLRTY